MALRVPTSCGGFVDLPHKVPELHSQTLAQVSYSRFTDETLRDDCVAMAVDCSPSEPIISSTPVEG